MAPAQASPAPQRGSGQRMSAAAALIAALAVSIALAACGGSNDEAEVEPTIEDPGPIHVHGLGVNPADGALFVATHTGLFRAPAGEQRARRVADRFQDTMGFTVVGPDRFLGSGHPDGRERLPPFLGLISSTDAGRSWKPVSLLGKQDFHVLEAAGRQIYGYGSDFESRQAGMLVSADGGRTWDERVPPEPLISLAIDPTDPQRVVASGEKGVYSSTDGGAGWRRLLSPGGLVAWTRSRGLYLVRADSTAARSGDGGRTWRPAGELSGQPAAFESAGDDLYVALHDGRIMRSADGARSWRLRSRP